LRRGKGREKGGDNDSERRHGEFLANGGNERLISSTLTTTYVGLSRAGWE
jgi:hypothetical protein